MSIIIAIIIFSLIILFHEFGHFIFAKANGIRVNEFCLGLGPTLVGFTKGETKYSIKLLPFGGACMMEGEDDDSEDERAFNKKPVWGRISVVAAGPVFNFIMAFILAVVVISMAGYGESVIGEVAEGSTAQEAGLQPGDRITGINHKKIHLFKEITFYTYVHQGEEMLISYERNGEEQEVTLTPTYSEEYGRYMLGINSTAYKKGNVLRTIQYSIYEIKYYIDTTMTSLKLLVTGGVSLNDLSGPVGIVSSIGQTYEQSQPSGAKYVFLNMCIMCILLSANLGVMNLLPLPALDGGRLLFLFVEAIRGKRIDPNKEGMIHFAGLILLLGLMVLVMFNDIRKLVM
ncbi:MAG: RIP metalloprotease RseP [Lachnospiraceae bacterium]